MAGQQKKTIELNIDLYPQAVGFDSASHPTAAHHIIMKRYASPWLLGPAPSELLLEMVLHMYTDDEADLVVHLPIMRPQTAIKIAKKAGRSLPEVEQTLHRLAFTKKVILAAGDPRKYTILPVVPGTFEMALMTTDLTTHNQWHQKFAELFERLWDTGFTADYPGSAKFSPVRYLPVGEVSDTLQMAWPSDKLEQILGPYDDFAVGHCQCRIAMQMIDKGCGKPTENCVSMGPMTGPLIERGMMRKTDRAEVIAIKREAEKAGCVTWMMNGTGGKYGNGSCSCCGCCCHALRGVKEFNTPGLISKPHFLPKYDPDACTLCEECVDICPMNAWSLSGNQMSFNRARCIGCGLCVGACDFGALELTPVDEVVSPVRSMKILLLGMSPGYLTNSVRVWAKRLFTPSQN